MRRWGGIGLLAVAGFMVIGFLNSKTSHSVSATIVALLITVGIPGVTGIALLGGFGGPARARRLEDLRQRTIEAEILRMAMKENGRLTAVEVATALALSPETAKATLDTMVERDVADIAVSDDGVIVYTFHDAAHLGGKREARGLLDG
jgi:hypothetical protein